jgi:hypothetical protein
MSEPENSSVEPEALILRLVLAMEGLTHTMARQVEAIDRLAASNEELVDVMMQPEPEKEEPDELDLDMAGKPLRTS